MNALDIDPERQVSGIFAAALTTYLTRAGGPGIVAEVVARAGGRRTEAELRRARWGSRQEFLDLVDAAIHVTGDGDIGRRVGEEMFRINMADNTTRAFLLAAGHPLGALEAVLQSSAQLGRGRAYRIVSSDQSGCVVEGRYGAETLAHPHFCSLALGYWPMLAGIFGGVGTAYHPSCQCRGDEVCRFVLKWDAGTAAGASEIEAAEAEVHRGILTFEAMQQVAEDLARAGDLPSLAERILDAMEAITPAPGLLVAIHADKRKPPIVAHRGMSTRAARSLAGRLLDGTYGGRPAISAMAPLAEFGLVAAIAPDARSSSATSSRLLQAFARHAGARVEAVLSWDMAEESRQTASALLRLAGSLAEATTEDEISKCLAKAIPHLVGADHSAVLRWNPENFSLRTAAAVGPKGRRPFQEFTVNQVPALYEMASVPAPFVLNRDTADPYVARAMDQWDERVDVIVPVVAQGDFLGFLSAGYRDESRLDRDAAFERLKGAAGLAGTAFIQARLLEEVRHQALHDQLTGLPNRVLLEDRVEQALKEARRHDQRVGLLFLDLDRFKNLNDSMGHAFGDAIIQAASARIQGSLRESDVFARMGGDEFVIVLNEVEDPKDAEIVATKILESLREPFDIGGRNLYISASIGVAVYPEDGDDYGVLLQSADRSMYAAKNAGRNTVGRRSGSGTTRLGPERLALETELHQALEKDQLEVVYQPEVAMADLKLVGVEALVRWNHPRLGFLSPARFLPIAEECGLMPRLDRLVRRMAFQQAREWQKTVGRLLVAVNVSAQSLRRPGLLEEVAADLAEFGVDPSALELELTEGMVADGELFPVVEGLSGMGLHIAVDDFGTGASTFGRLQTLPVDVLKIDRSLVQGREAARDASILGAIIDMAHSLGLKVVAEGVENPVQAGNLRRAGCDRGQGYLFGRPVRPEDLEAVIYCQLAYLDSPAFGTPAHRPHPAPLAPR